MVEAMHADEKVQLSTDPPARAAIRPALRLHLDVLNPPPDNRSTVATSAA